MKRIINIEPTPKELAEVFIGMFSDEQVEFFNQCAKQLKDQKIKRWVFQIKYIANDKELTPDGRNFMRQIGEYVEAEKV